MNKGSSMNTNSDISNVRPRVVAFVKCDDATTFGRMINLTADEERRVRNVLAAPPGLGAAHPDRQHHRRWSAKSPKA
jgi:hypothetical protein